MKKSNYILILLLPFLIYSCSSSVYNVEVSDIRDIKDFHEELAGVLIGEYWGFINTKGDFVIEHQYKEVKPFNEKLAAVKLNTKWGYIDKQENMVIPAQYEDAKGFNEGYAPVKKDNKWGYIKSNGKIKIDFQFEDALPFSDGLAAVKINGLWGYIKTNGNFKIEPKYLNARAFKNGMAPVQESNLWGYINSSGDYDINPIFEEAMSFSIINSETNYKQYLAAVNLDGNWGYTDMSGTLIINPKYDAALPFTEDAAWVCEEGKWGLIDRKDNVLIEFNYDYAGMFGNGYSAVIHNGKKFYIDEKGRDAGILKITAYAETGENNSNSTNSVVLTPSVGRERDHCATNESTLGIYNFLEDRILLECEGCYAGYNFDKIIVEPKSTYIPTSFKFSNDKAISNNVIISVYSYDTMRTITGKPEGSTINYFLGGNKKYLLLSTDKGIFISDYHNVNWVKSDDGLKYKPSVFAFSGEYVFAATGSGVYIAGEFGKSKWKEFGMKDEYVSRVINYKDKLYATTPDGLYTSKTDTAEWKRIYKANNQYPAIYFINDTIAIMLKDGRSIMYSDSELETWNEMKSPLNGKHISDIHMIDNKIFVSLYVDTTTSGVYYTTNLGASWKKTEINNQIYELAYFENRLYASGNGIFLSEDKGSSWKQISRSSGFRNYYYMTESNGILGIYDNTENLFQIPGTKKLVNVNYYTEIKSVYIGVPPFGHLRRYPMAHVQIHNLATGNVTEFRENYGKNSGRISNAYINALYTQAGNINIWAQALNMESMGISACREDFFKYEKKGWNNPMTVILENKDNPFVPEY